ncbi:hypothetical protein Tco_0864928 [Tanacetum coccineum]
MRTCSPHVFERAQCSFENFSLSPRQMALWQSQMEDHTSDWLRVFLWFLFRSRAQLSLRSGVSAGKEVNIELGGGRDKPLRPADMLLYSWDRGLDVCVDLTGSSPLTQTGMVDFVAGHAVTDATHRKRVKYETKCSDIRYDFSPFHFLCLGN